MRKASFKIEGINQQGSAPGSAFKWLNGCSAHYPLDPIPVYLTCIKPHLEREMVPQYTPIWVTLPICMVGSAKPLTAP